MSGVWTRSLGVTLVASTREQIAAHPSLVRALTDGVDRSGPAVMPPEDDQDARDAQDAQDAWYEVREGGATVGVARVQRDHPRPGQAALVAVATAPEARGRAISTKVVLAAERRLAAEGFAPLLVRVPRTNGRGLYFMLRCGFTPVPAEARPEDAGDATWFARLRDRERLLAGG